MTQAIFLVPTSENVGLSFTTNALLDALQQQEKNVKLLKVEDIGIEKIELLLSENKTHDIADNFTELFFQTTKDTDIILIKGLNYTANKPYAAFLNGLIAHELNSKVVLVAAINYDNTKDLPTKIRLTQKLLEQKNVSCIINKAENQQQIDPIFLDGKIRLIGCIPLMSEPNTRLAANSLLTQHIQDMLKEQHKERLTPALFRYKLIKQAKEAQKTIVLPEGNEVRTITAANICTNREIANCILLGKEREIRDIAQQNNIELNNKLQIIDPNNIYEQYIDPMVELRKNKGLTKAEARKQLQDKVVLGTMMVQLGDADGLVSGAIHTTANTIRPALQLIKMPKTTKLVSSILFICFPKQVLVFGDCAINPKPNAEQLANIAIQSADSAANFGVEPRVAMISYSSGTSSGGEDVEKVAAATKIAQQLRPDLLIDGPIQYDAAIIPEVAAQKMPNSPVAGKATILIFPDLDTGNTVYKCAQRTGNLLAIGPMLQGINKPVNDLSRGCFVEDIVFTITLTAVQAINRDQ